MTALGAVRVGRRHDYCTACRQPALVGVGLLGLGGWLTARARRMASRDRAAPAARALVTEVEEAQAFGPRCQAEAERPGIKAAGRGVLGDGAEWIWTWPRVAPAVAPAAVPAAVRAIGAQWR